jgi:NAD(P)H-flavin reductase
MQGMELHVTSITDTGPVRIMRLECLALLPEHQAGHYAVLQFGDHAPRPYSIANPPNGRYLEFHIKNGGHAGGSTHATTQLSVGDKVTLHHFGGNYNYKADCPLPLLLIAGGTGLSPLLAIALASLKDNPARAIQLFHGGRFRSDLYHHVFLQNLSDRFPHFTYTPCLSDETSDGIETGYVGDIALAISPTTTAHRLYIAGPVDMVRATVNKALANGLHPDVIHSDLAEMTK